MRSERIRAGGGFPDGKHRHRRGGEGHRESAAVCAGAGVIRCPVEGRTPCYFPQRRARAGSASRPAGSGAAHGPGRSPAARAGRGGEGRGLAPIQPAASHETALPHGHAVSGRLDRFPQRPRPLPRPPLRRWHQTAPIGWCGCVSEPEPCSSSSAPFAAGFLLSERLRRIRSLCHWPAEAAATRHL